MVLNPRLVDPCLFQTLHFLTGFSWCTMLGCISYAMLWNLTRCDWCGLTWCVTKQHIRSQTWREKKPKLVFFFFSSKPKLMKHHIYLKRWTSFKHRGVLLNVGPTEKFSILSRKYLLFTLLVLSRVQSKLEKVMSLSCCSHYCVWSWKVSIPFRGLTSAGAGSNHPSWEICTFPKYSLSPATVVVILTIIFYWSIS